MGGNKGRKQSGRVKKSISTGKTCTINDFFRGKAIPKEGDMDLERPAPSEPIAIEPSSDERGNNTKGCLKALAERNKPLPETISIESSGYEYEDSEEQMPVKKTEIACIQHGDLPLTGHDQEAECECSSFLEQDQPELVQESSVEDDVVAVDVPLTPSTADDITGDGWPTVKGIHALRSLFEFGLPDESIDNFERDLMYAFELDWDCCSRSELMNIFKENDPFRQVIRPASLKDYLLLRFAWTLCRCTRFFGIFVSLPQNLFDELMLILRTLYSSIRLVKETIMYRASIFVIDSYRGTPYGKIWKRLVVTPIGEEVRASVDDRSEKSFERYVVKALASVVLFSVDLHIKEYPTRKTLEACAQYLTLASYYQIAANTHCEEYRAATKLLEVVRELLLHLQLLTIFGGNIGGEIDKLFSSPSKDRLVLLDNGISSVTRYHCSLRPFLFDLALFLNKSRINERNFGGANILKLIYLESDEVLIRWGWAFGMVSLEKFDELEKGAYVDSASTEMTECSIKMTERSIKITNDVFLKTVRFYLEFFFARQRDSKSSVQKLNRIMGLIKSDPHHQTGNLTLLWIVNVCCLGSIALGDGKLFDSFCSILKYIGIKNVAFRKLRYKVEFVKQQFVEGKYENMASARNDHVIF